MSDPVGELTLADTFAVLTKRDRLPEPADLESALRKARLPLRLPESWSWTSDTGWRPMTWRGESSGCEVEIEALSRKDSAAAGRAGFEGLDCAVLITPRGWDSFQSAVCFGAALASETQGCVSEDEGKFLDGKRAFQWARRIVRDSDAAVAREAAQQAAHSALEASGGAHVAFAKELEGLVGSSVSSSQIVMDSIFLVTERAAKIIGPAWKVRTMEGELLEHGRYAALNDAQLEVLSSGEPQLEIDKKLEAIEAELDGAARADEAVLALAARVVPEWMGQRISSASYDGARTIRIGLENGVEITFVGRGFSGMTLRFGVLSFNVSVDGLALK